MKIQKIFLKAKSPSKILFDLEEVLFEHSEAAYISDVHKVKKGEFVFNYEGRLKEGVAQNELASKVQNMSVNNDVDFALVFIDLNPNKYGAYSTTLYLLEDKVLNVSKGIVNSLNVKGCALPEEVIYLLNAREKPLSKAVNLGIMTILENLMKKNQKVSFDEVYLEAPRWFAINFEKQELVFNDNTYL